MGLKNFLQQRGFIEDDSKPKTETTSHDGHSTGSNEVAPTYFPITPSGSSANGGSDPSFVTPLQTSSSSSSSSSTQLDSSFVKFFEDELTKANLPGPDYFEFRQQLIKTQQKMAAKGMGTPEVILQAVLMSFEAQDIQPSSLVETAKKYKDIIKQKNDDFLKGAAAEKNNQLQKRQSVLQSHNDAINKIQSQLLDLETQRRQLEDAMNREKTQMEADKSMGQEGIAKIERAENQIVLAHEYIQSTIDNDIKRLQSVN